MTASVGIRPTAFTKGPITGVSWTSTVLKYPTDPPPLHDFRCDFAFVEWAGGGALVTAIQDVRHVFNNGQVFKGPVPVEVGKLGLYASEQLAARGERNDLVLRIESEAPPRFGRCVEIVDGIGWRGLQVYTRGQIDQPCTVFWQLVRRKRRRYVVAGLWPWDLHMSVFAPNVTFPHQLVATFYVPRKSLAPKPLTLWPEYFDSRPLADQPTEVMYGNLRALVDGRWRDMREWHVEANEFHSGDRNLGWSVEKGTWLVLRCGTPGVQNIGERLVLPRA